MLGNTVIFIVVNLLDNWEFIKVCQYFLEDFLKKYSALAVISRLYSTVSVTIRHNPTRQKITRSILSPIMDIEIVVFVGTLIFEVGFLPFDSFQERECSIFWMKISFQILLYPSLSYFILANPSVSSQILTDKKQPVLYCL